MSRVLTSALLSAKEGSCGAAVGLDSTDTGIEAADRLDGFETGIVVARDVSTGKRVKLIVLVAPGAVIGRCGRGVPHMPQKRLVAGLSEPQFEQTKLPPGGFPILT